jgi:peptidoglycan/xylan/chitin deacetylase (PgdA/CDA1 family)
MNYMTMDGISFQSHTIHHLERNDLSPERQLSEMKESRELFNQLFHQDTILLSYLVGRSNDDTVRLAEETGYRMAVSTEPGAACRDQGLYSLHRVRISPGLSADAFGNLVEHAD